MKDIPFYDVDNCMYSDWGYKKRTRIWTNKEDWQNKLCDGRGSCGNMINITSKANHMIHNINLGNADNDLREKNVGRGINQLDRYRVPEDLIFSLFLE